jgi:transposase
MVQKELVFILFAQNWSIRKINKALDLHRATITRYHQEWRQRQQQKAEQTIADNAFHVKDISYCQSAQTVPPGEKQLPTDQLVHFQLPPDSSEQPLKLTSKSKAVAYHDIILNKWTAGQNGKSIYQDLVTDNDFVGSYDCIKRYLRKLTQHSPKLYARLEMPPGEEAQVDFGKGAPTLKNGRYQTPWLFVMTLSCSRKSYQQAVWSQELETFIRCHEQAFHDFGGVCNTVKIDNLKAAVLKAHLYEPEINPTYLAFAQHYHFAPLPCKVRTPEHKGKVESNIDYVQDNALTGKKFNSLDEQNQYLRHWNKTWASTRIHGTTKRQVNVMFEEEKPHLQPLPETAFAYFKIGSRKVNVVDSHIEVAGAYYPIPPQYMGKQVTVHFNQQWVKVFYQQQIIQFLSTVAKGRFHPDRRCFPANKNFSQNQYVHYLFSQCENIGPTVSHWAHLAQQQRQQRAYRAIQGIVALAKKYPYATINQACQQSIEQNCLSYHLVKNAAEQISIQQQIQVELQFTQQSDLIRSPLEYQQLLTQELTHGRTDL